MQMSPPGDVTEGHVRFAVLGPLVVTQGQSTVPVPAAMHRAVLSVLLTHANSTVSAERLLGELWGSSQPRSARKTLQGYIWRLRRALPLGEGQLATVSAGYRLTVETNALDALEFEFLTTSARSHLRAGRRVHAADALARALRLWRGDAFDGVPDTMAVRVEAERLSEVMLGAFELFVDIQLELGRTRDMIPRIRATANSQPYRESLQRRLMTALYCDGRPLDALEVYDTFRRRVKREFGLDPHHDTAELHQSILRGSPAERYASA